jgi:hypothetical protein
VRSKIELSQHINGITDGFKNLLAEKGAYFEYIIQPELSFVLHDSTAIKKTDVHSHKAKAGASIAIQHGVEGYGSSGRLVPYRSNALCAADLASAFVKFKTNLVLYSP